MTTVAVTRDEAKVWSSNPILLPVLALDVEGIVVDLPCKFKSMNPERKSVQPTGTSMVPIKILYHCD